VKHDGTTPGYLYVVAEEVRPADVYPHPHPVNAGRWECRVCEKSGRAGLGNKEAESDGWTRAQMLAVGGDLRGAGAADEREDEIAHRGHDLGSGATAQPGAILPEGHITQPMAALHAPVAADQDQ